MPGLNKNKPPNAFSWFARYVADQRRCAGLPYRSVKAVIHDAASQWEKLTYQEKEEWKEKARAERARFRDDPELRTMTSNDFIAQACVISTNGMTASPGFWTRHWSALERHAHEEDLEMLEKFDTKKRHVDRENILNNWKWNRMNNSEEVFTDTFTFISVQSSSPVEAEAYVPETLAIAQFSVNGGYDQFSEFSCGLAAEDDSGGNRRAAGAAFGENNVGDEDGCQARVSLQKVAKLIFQRVDQDAPGGMPFFFCLAEEYEGVYDTLSNLKVRANAKLPQEYRWFSVKHLATLEDLAYCLMKWKNIPFPPIIAGGLQSQFYFDTLIERTDPLMVVSLRCGAHESDSITRCPLSVIRLAANKIKEWMDIGGIPEQEVPLIERQSARAYEWPEFQDQGSQPDDSDDDGEGERGAVGVQERERYLTALAAARLPVGKHEMTLAWVAAQGADAGAAAEASTTESPSVPKQETSTGKTVTNETFSAASTQNAVSASRQQSEKIRSIVNDSSASKEKPVPTVNAAVGAAKHIRSIAELYEIRSRNVRRAFVNNMGPEIEYQEMLPFGGRGIGRGMHLIPNYAMQLQNLKMMMDA